MLLNRSDAGDVEAANGHLAIAQAIAEELGMPALLARLGEVEPAAGTPAATAAVTSGEEALRREGDVWALTYDGHTFRLRDTKGMQYLAVLLASPGREIPAIDLVSRLERPVRTAAADHVLRSTTGPGVPVVDAAARAEYRVRLSELQEEIDEAEQFGDGERAERLRLEFDFITSELAAAVGLGGRTRTHTSEAERARQSTTKAIRQAIDRIAAHDQGIAEHLRHAVRTGVFCVYAPDPLTPVRWTVVDR
jgi:non-specific serine/threonine protein kinase